MKRYYKPGGESGSNLSWEAGGHLALSRLGEVELFEHQGVLLEVGALADDQAFDGQVAQGLEPFVVAEIRVFEVEVLDLALVPVVDAGDVDVDVAQGPRPEPIIDGPVSKVDLVRK